jgi:hypothetical protein
LGPSRQSGGGTPHPNLPPQGGKGLIEHVAARFRRKPLNSLP